MLKLCQYWDLINIFIFIVGIAELTCSEECCQLVMRNNLIHSAFSIHHQVGVVGGAAGDGVLEVGGGGGDCITGLWWLHLITDWVWSGSSVSQRQQQDCEGDHADHQTYWTHHCHDDGGVLCSSFSWLSRFSDHLRLVEELSQSLFLLRLLYLFNIL